MSWASAYVGLPYRDRGRDRAGVDCWGLYRLVWGEQKGVWLPAWDTVGDETPLAIVHAMKAEAAGGGWVATAAPEPFDLVQMTAHGRDADGRLRRLDLHIGCVAPGGRVLHVERGIDALCVPLDHPSVRDRIVRFGRPAREEGH